MPPEVVKSSGLRLALCAGRQVPAPPEVVWEAFCAMLDWLGPGQYRGEVCQAAAGRPGGPRVGDRLGYRLRPIWLPFSVPAEITRSLPGRELAWRGRWLGITVRRRIGFSPNAGGTWVSSEEELAGWALALLRPFYSPRRLGAASQLWLDELARRAQALVPRTT